MAENILTIKHYFKKGTFVIPNYQRGYKWGVPDKNGQDAVSILMDSLITAYKDEAEEYFIQGVTVYEEGKNIVLVDGQQRTTIFYLLLKYLDYDYDKLPKINYTIREESDYVLNNSKIEDGKLTFTPEKDKSNDDYDLQDIYYFKKAIGTFHTKLTKIDKKLFEKFILNKVNLFYITIVNKEDATKVFSMMNANKAFMKTDELIKATVENFKDSPAILTMIEHIPGKWDMAECNMKYKKKDAYTLEFEIELPAHGKKELSMHYNRRNLR